MHSLTQSSMPAHSIATATALLTAVALGCIFALSVLSDGYHDQRLRPISLPRTFRGTKTIDQVRQRRPVAFMRNIAHGRRLSNDQDSDIPDNYGDKQGHQEPALSLALVRPISVRDADALVNSFIYWDEFAPGTNKGCRSIRGTQSARIDIIISFSREFDKQKYPDIAEAIEAVHSLFEKTIGWGGCVQSVNFFEARIHPEEDLYDPLLAEQGNQMWANGPNRQFERTFRYVQSLEKYDAMFLMESDTYPAADGWLDLLVEEVKSSAPFALLGSKYNGHAWDDFAEQMPLALLHHVNGNAIYNTTHPFLEHIVSELEDEADTWYNAITYDYRISQILLEGSTGALPDFPYANVGENGNRIKLQRKTEKFSRWWEEYPDTYELVQESNVMTNLGSTAFLPGDVEDGIALVHGKNMYLPWNSSIHGTISLVVSDWRETDESCKELLTKLAAINHPFSQIILMVGLESEAHMNKVLNWCDCAIDLPVAIQTRTDDRSMDLCSAESATDYLMLTDVGHKPAKTIDIMVASDGSNRPVIPFVSSESVHCSSYQPCDTAIQRARHFFDSMDRFVFSDEMLYRRDLLQEFCNELSGQKNHEITSVRNLANLLVEPTATSYIAYLHRIEAVYSYYAFSNIVFEGSRRNFVPADPTIPLGLKYHAAEIENRSGIDTELPVLWHIPKSGGTTITTLLSRCLRKAVASSSGVALERRRGVLGATELPTSLHVVQKAEEIYISVDMSSPEGIARARNLDLLGSDLADVIITPLLARTASDLYSSEIGRRARIFSVFRHPVDRAASLFYYLRNAMWEPTYDPSLQNMTLEEYASSEKAESNWMVRMLNNEPAVVDERHLQIAKDIIREKVLVGLMSHLEESVERFYSYFGWRGEQGGWNNCERRLLTVAGANTNKHQALKEGTPSWNLLASRNSLDVALYDYAVELFHHQGAILFESNSFSLAGSLVPKLTGNSDVVDDEIHQLLDMNAGRQLESNVADGDIVSIRNPLWALSCSEITDSNACAGRQNCVWKESSKICESNVFGHSAKVEYKSHSRKACMLLQPKRNMLRCLKRKKRLCRAIEHRDRKLKCRNKQRKKIKKIRKAINSRALSQSASFQSHPLYVLSLGGSVTWGSQLGDRSLAYPALLSKLLPGTSFTTNIAMRATGSDYASMCLQSMIIDGQTEQNFYFETQENDINYDIITIEYSLNGVEALPRLLQRLRARYPDATIIYINLYSWAKGVIESTSQQRIFDIKARIMKEDGPEKMAEWIAGLNQNYHRQLTFRGHLSAAKFSLIEGSIQKYGGIMYNWPVPTNPIDDLIWFGSDLYHLNAAGHRRVAEDVAKVIVGILKAENRALGSFGSWEASNKDQCTSWYSSGIATQIELNKDISLFSPGKYAVEATKDSVPLKIVFVSRFNRTVPVALSVMAHKSVYPKAIVGVHKNLEKIQADHLYELDPTNRIVAARVNHVVQTHIVGYAVPGRNIISVVTLDESQRDWPLRITGILMCDECDLEQGNGGGLAVPQGDNLSLAIARLTEKPKATSFDNRPSMHSLTGEGLTFLPKLHDTNITLKAAYKRTFESHISNARKQCRDFCGAESLLKTSEIWASGHVHHNIDSTFVVLSKGGKLVFSNKDTEGNIPQAAAWNETFAVPSNNDSQTFPNVWIKPTEEDRVRPTNRIFQGDSVTFISWFMGNYGHFLHDHLPIIAWLREILSPKVKILLLHHPLHEEILKTVDAQFVNDRVEWVRPQELIQVNDGILATLILKHIPHRTAQTVESLGRWLNEVHHFRRSSRNLVDSNRNIIYYTRGGSADTHHGRVVERSHEADIIALIQSKMRECKRSEKFIIFNGQKEGKTMKIQDQFELFRGANTVIGPHGSGLANIVWMNPSAISAQRESAFANRPVVLEFLLGPDSAHVHPPCKGCKGLPFTRTYYQLFSTIPWVDYNHLLYAANSTEATTFIDLDTLEMALSNIWCKRDGRTSPPLTQAALK